ncbi:MAG: ABC transporter ATP-binding protein [Jatrophihabitans sp.]
MTATLERVEPDSGTAAPRIALDGVRRVFGRGSAAVAALDGIDLQVAPGELVTVVGASGCGKSTLLSLIAGLDKPTSGTVSVLGGQPALMFQEAALFPWLTAAGNVELALKLRKVGRAERGERARELLDLVQLGSVADRRAHELSGGQRQRVALARSLSQDASVLLMDEPFAALDAITRDVLHSELISLWQRTRISIVFVTHNVREAVRLGQRVVLLSSRPGRVVRQWQVGLGHPRAIEDAGVGALSREITSQLREEIGRHAR